MPIRTLLRLVGVFIALLLAGSACDPNEDPVARPIIHATVSPHAGNTTHTFIFNLTDSDSRSKKGNRLFTRWDWDGDGIWDTPLTRLQKYEHRYYVPGTWHARAEMVNLDGGSDTVGFIIPVERGYSAPRPLISFYPATGHIFTQFLLDGSGTRDDEDSLGQLKFRWDFEGDGVWDNNWNDSCRISHVFSERGYYTPSLQVKDPSGLISQTKSQLIVTLDDPRLVASFRCIPDSVTDGTPINLDASASIDLDYPDKPLAFRWDLDNNKVWDTEWLTDPVFIHSFGTSVFAYFGLQVKSFRGLFNDTICKIRVYHRNRDPRAAFGISTQTGNCKTQFRFDCWFCRDLESAPSDMFYRWDFDGDGQFDTEPSHDVVTLHTYTEPGTYQPLLELTDVSGGTDTCSSTVWVSNGTNQTDMIRYGQENFGTVLIGDQWWFSRNLSTQDTAKYYLEPFTNEWEEYYKYGNLYTVKEIGLPCPEGWRVPTRQDWAKLFSNYSDLERFDALLPGGRSDFGLLFSGRGEGLLAPSAELRGLGSEAHFWTSSYPIGGEPTNKWIVSFYRNSRTISQGFNLAGTHMYSIRCVKDNR